MKQPSTFALPAARLAALIMAAAAAAAALHPAPAAAQSVVTAVNGNPITTFDVAEYGKILRLDRRPASPADALEAVVADRLRFDEAHHWGVDATDADLASALQKAAATLKMDTSAYSEAAAKAKIDITTIRNHFRAVGAWDTLVRARNRGVGATEEEIAAAVQKGGGFGVSDYRLQQIIFVLPANPPPALIEARMASAKALRNRFDGCANGLQLARSLPDVAVKEPMSRTSDSLNPVLRKTLAETSAGMLTSPERSTSGIEMLAVCDKSAGDTNTLHDQVQKNIVTDKLVSVSAQMYKDLRKTAVISKN